MKGWLFIAAGAAGVGGLVGAASGAERAVSPFGNRYDGLKLVFAEQALPRPEKGGMRLESAEALWRATPEQYADWLIVAMGDSDPAAALDAHGVDLERFLEQGGAVLLATDAPTDTLLRGGNLRVRAAQVQAEHGYFGQPTCIVVRDFDREIPLFDGVGELVVNRPGIIERAEPGVVARLPAGTNVDGERRAEGPGAVLARTVSRGRIVVVSDQSLFANEMLLEAGNLAFARNVARWLTQTAGRRRTRVTFLTNGVAAEEWIDQDFLKGDFTRPLALADLFAVGNEFLSGIQKEGVPNALAAGAQGRLDPVAVRRSILLVPVVALAGLFAWRLAAARGRGRGRARDRSSGGAIPLVRSAGGSP